MTIRTALAMSLAGAALLPGCAPALAQSAPATTQATTPAATPAPTLEQVRERLAEDEVVYFVLPDRFDNGDPANDDGGYGADRLVSGYDPTHKGFYHGGDLAGLTARLDYLQGMGITAIWFAPIFANKPVQGPAGDESAGYHGYWVTDFTRIDPHFGTNEEFRTFVDAAHARGMKVYMDIITNHTADVIKYREGFSYRSKGDYPYSTRGGPDGAAINEGFMGDEVRTEENFARLTDMTYAYTPYVPEAERDVKVPAWLNDPRYYHNRGDTTFSGESARLGDFVGLDDIYTEQPFVVRGMIDIYAQWIEDFGIDGFRIDTARHVNPGFWREFVPAMLATADAQGIPNFLIFGEVYAEDPMAGYIAEYTRRDGFPAVLDFAFQQAVLRYAGAGGDASIMTRLFDGDVLYEGGEAAALKLPTFLGNHDMGRFTTMTKQRMPGISQEELLARTQLAHAMLMTLRGNPVVYSGDEQGFVGDGNDQAAREDMFPSRVASYNDNDLIGTDATTATDNFDRSHPLYRLIAQLSAVRQANPALRRGLQTMRQWDDAPGMFAVTRHDPESGQRVLLAFNNTAQPLRGNVAVDYAAREVTTLAGAACPATVAAPGSVAVTLPAFGWAVCELK